MPKKLDPANPGMKYRPIPFWSWNDKLDPEELRKQVRAMYEAGMGGFFMHARGGLKDLDKNAHNAFGRVVFAAELAFVFGEVLDAVFVGATK